MPRDARPFQVPTHTTQQLPEWGLVGASCGEEVGQGRPLVVLDMPLAIHDKLNSLLHHFLALRGHHEDPELWCFSEPTPFQTCLLASEAQH